MVRRSHGDAGHASRLVIVVIGLVVFVSARVAWWLDRTPSLDEAFGEAELVPLRWLAGTLSSLGSFDVRVVALAIVLTSLAAGKRFLDAGYVVVVVTVVHVVERIVKVTEDRRRPVDPEGAYFLPDTVRLAVVAAAILAAVIWWRRRGGSVWRVVTVAALAGVLHSIGWLVRLIEVPERTDSFPSGHAANTMALGVVLVTTTRTSRRLAVAIVVATVVVMVGWSRIALGYHHPTDVVAGWALALVIAVSLDIVRGTLATRHSTGASDRDGQCEPPAGHEVRAGHA